MEPEVDVVIPTVRTLASWPPGVRGNAHDTLEGRLIFQYMYHCPDSCLVDFLSVGGYDGAAGPFPAQAVGASGSGAVGHLLLQRRDRSVEDNLQIGV